MRILPSRMTEHSRHRCAALLLTTLLPGCLPEPPAYNPCAEETSAYFAVAPQGCNGHELTTLWEDRREVTDPTGAVGLGRVELVLGNAGAYMTDWDGNILYAAESSNAAQLLFKSPAPGARLIGFDSSSNRLYASVSYFNGQNQRSLSQIFGIDVETGESRVLVDLADTLISTVAVIGNRFYFASVYQSALFAGPLDWDATSGIADLQTCVPASLMTQFAISNSTLYNLDYSQTLLVAVDLTTCSTTRVLSLEPPTGYTSLSSAEGLPYLQDCDFATSGCTLFRLNAEGTIEPMVRGYIMSGNASPVVAGNSVYLLAKLVGNADAQPTRLYTWGASPNSPIALAAPLAMVSQLALDAKYVYAVETTSDWASGIFDSPVSAHSDRYATSRFLRVRR